MAKMLVVDDELFAVKAIVQGVDWAGAGIEEVFTAADADEAMDVMRSHKIDLVICDIEMPGMSGLELREWVNEHDPSIVTVFLTGHADFSYAQQAIHLGGYDYLLKPVKREQLREVVDRALDKIRQEREWKQFDDRYQHYVQMWEQQKPVLVERFWQDILSERAAPTTENLERSLSAANLALTPQTPVVPILLSVERWHKELTLREEEIMEYALRNAAGELLTAGWPGDVIQDRSGINLALLYVQNGEAPKRCVLESACREYIEACSRYFYCTVSCFIGAPTAVAEMARMYHKLIELEHEHVAGGSVIRFSADEREKPQPARPFAIPIAWDDWAVLLEQGKRDELMARLNSLFLKLRERNADAETVEAVYHSLLHLVYHVAHKKGASVKAWTAGAKRAGDDAALPRTIAQLQAWAERTVAAALKHIAQLEHESSALIEKVKAYIHDHLKDVTREDIAAYVYLNAAYLSRLFKKETGQSLVEYIIQAKMQQAKIMLTESPMRISDICDSLGYDNFSHFGKMFKKQVGITPQEYRKRYQNLATRE